MHSSRYLINDDEAFFLDSGGRGIIYVPLRGVVMEVNAPARAALLPTGTERDRAKILSQISGAVAMLPRHALGKDLGRTEGYSPYAVGLCLTNRCSLACTYCHADSGPQGATFLPIDIGKAALDFAFQNAVSADKCLELSFPGTGEPTEAWPAMTELVTHLESITRMHQPGHKVSMSTNGTFGRSEAEFIVNHFTGVSLSMDGPEDIQNAQRPFADGKGTFASVFATASFLYERNFLFSIRATVTELSVNRMAEVWNFFEEHFPGVPLGFERMNPLGRGQKSPIRPPSVADFNRNFENLLKEAEQHKGLLLNSGVGKLNQLQSSFCKSLSYPCMTVTPDGWVTACTRDGAPEFFYYGAWDPQQRCFSIDLEKVKRFRGITVDSFPECTSCFAKYHCAGDCQDLRRAGIRRCATNRRMIMLDLLHKLDYDKSITSVTPADPRYAVLSRRLYHK